MLIGIRIYRAVLVFFCSSNFCNLKSQLKRSHKGLFIELCSNFLATGLKYMFQFCVVSKAYVPQKTHPSTLALGNEVQCAVQSATFFTPVKNDATALPDF